MSDDIRHVLHRLADAELRAADAARPDPGEEVGLLARRVARRRAVRTGSTALAVVALVGGVGVGVQAWNGPTTPPPAHPAPTATPTPSISPSPSPAGPSASATIPVPEVEPSTFRDAPPLPPGMLETAGAGWYVVQYHPSTEQDDDILPNAAYLVSPDGRAFVFPNVVIPAGSYLTDWLPSTSVALVYGFEPGVHVMDLLTGAEGPKLADDEWTAFVGDGSDDVLTSSGHGIVRRLAQDGTVIAEVPDAEVQYGTSPWVGSPSGTHLVVNEVTGPRAVEARGFTPSPLTLPYPDRPDACRAWMWVDDEQVLVECTLGGDGPFWVGAQSELWLAPAGPGQARRLDGLDPHGVGGVWRVGDRLVAGTFGPTEATASWFDVTDGDPVPMGSGGTQDLRVFDVHGSELVAAARPYDRDGSGPRPSSIVAVDPVTGTVRQLVVGEPAYFESMAVSHVRYPGAPQTETGD
jgi:hypothetical protein